MPFPLSLLIIYWSWIHRHSVLCHIILALLFYPSPLSWPPFKNSLSLVWNIVLAPSFSLPPWSPTIKSIPGAVDREVSLKWKSDHVKVLFSVLSVASPPPETGSQLSFVSISDFIDLLCLHLIWYFLHILWDLSPSDTFHPSISYLHIARHSMSLSILLYFLLIL